jgi:hypothetical protein
MSEPGRTAPLISCREAVRQLWDYLDGAAVDQAAVSAHVAFCRRCCGEVEFVEHLRRLLADQVEDDQVPSRTLRRLERFVEEL